MERNKPISLLLEDDIRLVMTISALAILLLTARDAGADIYLVEEDPDATPSRIRTLAVLDFPS